MKKNISRILLGAVAGIASLFFAACSGDLHEPLESTIVPGGQPSVTSNNYFYFKANNQGTYYTWMWDDAGNGGDLYTVTAAWPGDTMFLVGPGTDGGYIYKYYITTTELLPSSLIISKDNGDSKFFDGVAFVNHGLYVEGSDGSATEVTDESTITTTPSNTGNNSGNNEGNGESGESGEGNGEGTSGGETPAAPVEITLDSTFLAKGDHDTSGVALTADAESEGAFYFTVNYRPSMSGWGGGNGNLHFKLNSGSTWYGFANVNAELSTSLAEGVSIAQGASDDHIVVQGLTDLTTYKISFKLTDDKTALVVSVAATGTFDPPAGPTSYAAIEADETPGDAPTDEVHELDETSGILYTMTGLPSWYGNDGVHIWAMVTDDEGTVYWKRVKFVASEGCIYFDSALTLKIVKTRRYKSDMSEYWNGSGSVDIVGTKATCTKSF